MSRGPGPYRPGARLGVLGLCLAAPLVLGVIAFDAAARRSARETERAAEAALVEATGLNDLALSSASRWLRHPSQAEPSAAVADLPTALDLDPGGALLGPPRRVLSQGGVEVEIR
jgi:hypothetical protein